MICTHRRRRICTALLLMLLAFIWGNSLLPAEISHGFSQWLKRLLTPFLGTDSPVTEEGNSLLRKLAHFLEFGCLGMCLAWRSGMRNGKYAGAFLSGVAAAAVDETIQRFVPGRFSSIKDVLLDSAGVLTGMLLLYLGHTILKKRITK